MVEWSTDSSKRRGKSFNLAFAIGTATDHRVLELDTRYNKTTLETTETLIIATTPRAQIRAKIRHNAAMTAIGIHGLSLVLLAIIFLSSCGAASIPSYDRKEWKHWVDADRDCQNTRAEILIIWSNAPVTFINDEQCTVATGLWLDPYSGKSYSKASDIDIDHIVPLKEAHISGAANWSKKKKEQYANHQGNLLPTWKSINRSKGSRDPAHWLPEKYRAACLYINTWLAIKNFWQLDQDEEESKATRNLGGDCSRKLSPNHWFYAR